MNEEAKTIFSKVVKEFRKSNKLTQIEFAKQIGLTQSAVSYWEIRNELPSRENMDELITIDNSFKEYFENEYLKERRKNRRHKDIAGHKYGKLTAIKPVGEKYSRTIWLCKCDCGKDREVLIDQLSSGDVHECEKCAKKTKGNNTQVALKTKEKFSVDGTNILSINMKKPKNNVSGVKGVSFISKTKKWRAGIGYKGEKIFLGEFVDKNSAIKARKEAEEKYYKPILDSYEKGIVHE